MSETSRVKHSQNHRVFRQKTRPTPHRGYPCGYLSAVLRAFYTTFGGPMAIEQSHGAARPTLPRSSDLTAVPEQVPATERTQGRDAKGRFLPGNAAGRGRHATRAIARHLGTELEGEAGELGREAAILFRAFLGDLPCDCHSVRSLVVQRARAAVLTARFARHASEQGLDTEAGRAALAESLRWDQRAERLAVTSMDISTRLARAAAAKPIDVHVAVADAFAEPTR